MRPVTLVLACLALAGCGHSKPANPASTFCNHLQDAGALLEPMSQCLREYRDATREPTITVDQNVPSGFFNR